MVVKSQELESDCLQIQILSPVLMTKWPWDNLMWLPLKGPSPGSWHMVSDQQIRAVIIHFARFPLSSSTDIILFDTTTPKNTIRPFFRCGNWSSDELCHLSRAVLLLSDAVLIWIEVCLRPFLLNAIYISIFWPIHLRLTYLLKKPLLDI